MLRDIPAMCKVQGISLSDLANRCRISTTYLSLITNEKRPNVSLRVLQCIAKELGITLSILLSNLPTLGSEVYLNSILDLWNISPIHKERFLTFCSQDQEISVNINSLMVQYCRWLDNNMSTEELEKTNLLAVVCTLLGGSIDYELALKILSKREFTRLY